jgi:hypothetical protein
VDDGYRRGVALQHAERAKSVLDHPGWVFFEQAVQTEIAEVTRQRDLHAASLLASLDPSVETMRYRLRHLDGLLIGLKYALELMPKAIAEGSVLSGVATQ